MGWRDQALSEAESGQRRLVRLKFARRSHRTHDAAILGVARHAHMQIYMSSGCGG